MVVTRSGVISWKKLELPEGDPQEGFGADAKDYRMLIFTTYYKSSSQVGSSGKPHLGI